MSTKTEVTPREIGDMWLRIAGVHLPGRRYELPPDLLDRMAAGELDDPPLVVAVVRRARRERPWVRFYVTEQCELLNTPPEHRRYLSRIVREEYRRLRQPARNRRRDGR
jgi:hypothetical protein